MDQSQCMATSRALPLIICISLFIAGCGSDISPGKIEGEPRTSESIYVQDLRFLETKILVYCWMWF